MKYLYISIAIMILTVVFGEEVYKYDRRIYFVIYWLPMVLLIIQCIILLKTDVFFINIAIKINKSKYKEVKIIIESILERNKKLKFRKNMFLYNLALCDSRLGLFKESNEIICKIESMKSSKTLMTYTKGMKALNMFFLNENYEEIQKTLSTINKNNKIKMYLLLDAIIEKRNSNNSQVNELLELYYKAKVMKFHITFTEIFIYDKYTKFLEKYLLYLFYEESKEIAKRDSVYNEIQKNSFYKENYEILARTKINSD